MKRYKVEIVQESKKIYTVDATSREKAEEVARIAYCDGIEPEEERSSWNVTDVTEDK